jgi:pullulanase
MKNIFLLFLMILITSSSMSSQTWTTYPIYDGNDLGVTYSPEKTKFRVWAPSASGVKLRLYKTGVNTNDETDLIQTIDFQSSTLGTWTAEIMGDQKGVFYTYQTIVAGKMMNEVPDIYAKSVGVNGKRGIIIDLKDTNPKGWENDRSPSFRHKTDAVIYELHVRDASISENSGIKNKGKFLGLTEVGTKNTKGQSTGLDHIKALGVTHVQLLPIYDYFTIDESMPLDPKKYNWGYDPLNYNTPEGSYSTNPKDGITRIKELKQLIQTFHNNGIRVVMDVVYNHTMFGEESYFHQLVPNYYHRQDEKGGFSNGSGCGNETASDRDMMRKFMIESVKYWVNEYHIDGFRFDLMALHDIQTMNLISNELHAIRPDILIHGEGWTGGGTPLEDGRKATKQDASKLSRIAVFSDDMRDALKGGWNNHNEQGFVSGRLGQEETIKFGIVAATQHPQIDYASCNMSHVPWAKEPYQCLNYNECHDNHTLWDRFLNSNPNDDDATKTKMHRLAQTIVFTSQGIPFMQAGAEFMRTKKNVENSFNHPDEINRIDWDRKMAFIGSHDYYKSVISMRKAHPAFRMSSTKLIAQHLVFQADMPLGCIAYTLNGKAVEDPWGTIFVVYNSNRSDMNIQLPVGKWKKALYNGKVYDKPKGEVSKSIKVEGLGTLILVQ